MHIIKTLTQSLRVAVMSGLFALTLGSGSAQVPDTLIHNIPAPPIGVQSGAKLGNSVAMDGGYTVVGAPLDSTGESGGTVKVFDSATGALLFLLPGPVQSFQFGYSVAISGVRVVVGSPYDDTGAGDAGSAYVYDLSSGTPTMPVVTLNNPNPAANDNFGYSLAISGTRVVVGARYDDMGANDAGSAYVFDLSSGTPTVPVATLNNPNPTVFDQFGNSVAISGMLVAVGAYQNDTGGTNAGKVCVYNLSSGTPTVPVLTLNNPSPASYQFGYSVAISGTRMAVGANLDGTGAINTGRAYVYDLSNGTPTVPVATLNNPNPADGDSFGHSVAISGTRVVVGAPYDDATAASNAGSTYVYDLTSGTPTLPVATLNNPSPAVNDNFGYAVAVSNTRVVVGAWQDDTGATDAGSAYIYDMSSGTPTVPVTTLNHPGPAARDFFGYAVAISGTRVAVGAHGDDTGASDAGSVTVYDLTSGTPTVPVATLNSPSPTASGQIGKSVAISGTRVVVGDPTNSTGASSAGRAFVYDLTSGTPTVPVLTLNNPSPGIVDNFGTSVAISGTRVVVGVPQDDTVALDVGSAYVYDLSSGTPTVPVLTLNNPSPENSDQFGISVAISGTRVVVGAHQDNTGGPGGGDTGSAYVYDLSSGTPTVPVATLNNPGPAEGDNFGKSVAISGTRVVVGAFNDDTGASNAGSAYVYDLSNGTPTVPVATLNNPSPAVDDNFGWSVAISGTRVVVGARSDDTGATDTGSVYIYDVSSGTPTVPVATLNNPRPAVNDNFGYSVALDGSTIAIGAPFDDTVATDKGFAYIFAPADPDVDDDGLLDLWEYARFGSTAAHSALNDTDGDGIVELLELAFDRNPLLPDAAGSPQVVNEGGFLTLTVAKRAGVTYLGQSAASPEAAAFSAATTTVLLNNATTLKVRDNSPLGAGGQRFLRLKVTAAP